MSAGDGGWTTWAGSPTSYPRSWRRRRPTTGRSSSFRRGCPGGEYAAAAWPDHVRLLGPPARELARLADDKVFVRDASRGLGVPVPDSVVVASADLPDGFDRLARRLGVPFVAQAPEGAGGRGTYLVESPGQLLAAVAVAAPGRAVARVPVRRRSHHQRGGVVDADGVR